MWYLLDTYECFRYAYVSNLTVNVQETILKYLLSNSETCHNGVKISWENTYILKQLVFTVRRVLNVLVCKDLGIHWHPRNNH